MTASTAPVLSLSAPPFPRAAALAGAVWLGLAVAAGATGFLEQLPFPGPQLIILGLITGVVIAGLTYAPLRAWIDALPLRTLVGVHAVRFIGISFLVLAGRDELNAVFAARAGWGDVAVALGAIALVLSGDPVTAGRRLIYHAWNALGVLDLVVAVGTATIVTVQHVTPGIVPVLTLPLSIIPTLLLPLFVAGHVFIFRKLRGHGG